MIGTPAPKLSLSGHDLWTEFPFSKQYLAVLDEKVGEKAAKTSGKILHAMRESNRITIPELAEQIGVTERSIERNIQKLRENGQIARKKGAKGGHWEVLD